MPNTAKIIDIRGRTMINPQKEDGFTPIANEIMDALCRAYIPARERQCLDLIIRKTYGFNKKEDKISLSQFVNKTGIDKRSVRRSLTALENKNIIGVRTVAHTTNKKTEYKTSTYWFNKKYDEWLLVSGGMRTGAHRVCAKTSQKVCAPVPPTKDIYTKDNTTPEIFNFVDQLIDYMIETKKNKAPKKTPSLISSSIGTVEKLIRIDGFDLNYIKGVCRWAVKDDFYSVNFFSIAPLRAKSKNGATKFANMAAQYEKSGGCSCSPTNLSPEDILKKYNIGVNHEA